MTNILRLPQLFKRHSAIAFCLECPSKTNWKVAHVSARECSGSACPPEIVFDSSATEFNSLAGSYTHKEE